MSLEDRARRAARDAHAARDSAAKADAQRKAAEEEARRRQHLADGEEAARNAIKEWARQMQIADYSVSRMVFQPYVPDRGGDDPSSNYSAPLVPGHPDRFAATVIGDGHRFLALYTLATPVGEPPTDIPYGAGQLRVTLGDDPRRTGSAHNLEALGEAFLARDKARREFKRLILAFAGCAGLVAVAVVVLVLVL